MGAMPPYGEISCDITTIAFVAQARKEKSSAKFAELFLPLYQKPNC
jgi:hypothetical protein